MTDAPVLVHPFERAGLGKAPFRFTGMFESVYEACQGAPIQPGSSCDYCGQGIRYVCQIASADGRTFKVGCDCVFKVSHPGKPLHSAAKKAMLATQRKSRHTKDAARIDAAKAALEANPALLTDQPHPQAWRASKGETMRDSVLWFMANAGAAGKVEASKIIEKALAT